MEFLHPTTSGSKHSDEQHKGKKHSDKQDHNRKYLSEQTKADKNKA